MIFVGSRYEDEEVYYAPDPRSGTTRPTVVRTGVQQSTSGQGPTDLVWNAAYRLDQIGKRVYGSSENWWRVMDRNNDILNPWSITAGTRMRVT